MLCDYVIFLHSLWGLGRGPNKHFAFVHTKALLAEYVFEKAERNLLKIFFVFALPKMSKQCSWLSIATNRLLGLPQTPVYAESILLLRVQRTLFSASKNLENRLIQKRVR